MENSESKIQEGSKGIKFSQSKINKMRVKILFRLITIVAIYGPLFTLGQHQIGNDGGFDLIPQASDYSGASPEGYSYGGGDYYGYNSETSNDDERPRLNLGLRLRIPAFKFELPRFSLPKITISAKIRQPDRPRSITLPEINLDTSQGAGATNSAGGGYMRIGNNHKSSANYGAANSERTSSFSFSASEDEAGQNNNNGYNSNYGYIGQQPNHPGRYVRPVDYKYRYNAANSYNQQTVQNKYMPRDYQQNRMARYS